MDALPPLRLLLRLPLAELPPHTPSHNAHHTQPPGTLLEIKMHTQIRIRVRICLRLCAFTKNPTIAATFRSRCRCKLCRPPFACNNSVSKVRDMQFGIFHRNIIYISSWFLCQYNWMPNYPHRDFFEFLESTHSLSPPSSLSISLSLLTLCSQKFLKLIPIYYAHLPICEDI